MRMGEIKSIIDKAIAKDKLLTFNFENLYGGQLFRVFSYPELIRALLILKDQPWVNADVSIVAAVITKYGKDALTVDLSPEEHQQLSSLVGDINNNLPTYYALLDEFVEKQSPYTLNIKIPEGRLGSLEDLNKFNAELQEIFKLIIKHKGFNAETKFVGFDVGSSWYKIVIESGAFDAGVVYAGFLGIIKIAKELIGLRKDWLECEERKLNLKILNQQLEKNKLSDEKHIQSLFDEKALQEIRKLIEGLPKEDSLPVEVEASLMKGFNKVVKLLEVGTEFHPSLNPPNYIKEGNGNIIMIDYEGLRAAIEDGNKKKISNVKQIEDKSETDNGGET